MVARFVLQYYKYIQIRQMRHNVFLEETFFIVMVLFDSQVDPKSS